MKKNFEKRKNETESGDSFPKLTEKNHRLKEKTEKRE